MNRQSSNNNRRVRWRWLLRRKNALNHVYKSKNGRNFQFTKFSFIDFFLTDRRSLSGKRLKSARGKSFSCRFSFSAERNANTKATEYDKQLVLRIVKALLFIHQPDRVAPKASDVSAADWLYQQTWKNTIFFHACCHGFSQCRKSLYNTAVYVINMFNYSQFFLICLDI